MHVRISSFYEYHDLVYKIFELVVLVTKLYFKFCRAAWQQKAPMVEV